MKIKELIELLKYFDDETEVIFADFEPVVGVKRIKDEGVGKDYVVITDRK